ncbi:hypothetical protein PoB_005508700 [Plakobranchus ocellatus]|uniref:Uncharacterized protein n=1 Tax=Plakobranchus ocellatus TaxID=259542 RepID=A0AAV4CB34_9GAST|nr:hypothetical protein PoB_005508700 [Plakobranchus ocellatus]
MCDTPNLFFHDRLLLVQKVAETTLSEDMYLYAVKVRNALSLLVLLNRSIDFCVEPVHNKVISGFQALRQGANDRAGSHNRKVPADLTTDLLSTVPPTSLLLNRQ